MLVDRDELFIIQKGRTSTGWKPHGLWEKERTTTNALEIVLSCYVPPVDLKT
jgi:hypothetical protein